jgi:hypothetical protein
MKVGKKRKEKKRIYIFGYLLEITIKIWRFGIFFSSKSGEIGPFFPLEFFCIG